MDGKVKGMGVKTVNALTLKQRVKLFDWCKEHKDDRHSFVVMAVNASNDLGFAVTVYSMQNHFYAINGSKARTLTSPWRDEMELRLRSIEQRLGELERLKDVS